MKIQTANELKGKYRLYKGLVIWKEVYEPMVKANLEKLGCGEEKKVKCSDGEILPFICPDDHLCQKHQKEKEIYEEILN